MADSLDILQVITYHLPEGKIAGKMFYKSGAGQNLEFQIKSKRIYILLLLCKIPFDRIVLHQLMYYLILFVYEILGAVHTPGQGSML